MHKKNWRIRGNASQRRVENQLTQPKYGVDLVSKIHSGADQRKASDVTNA